MAVKNEVPEKLDATWLKRFFKNTYGIPVRVKSGGTYLGVWIQSKSSRKLDYEHEFPDSLGNRCMRAIYPHSEKLSAQNWGGNVQPHSIAMHPQEWREVLQGVIDQLAPTSNGN